jgi:hypothetical protein
MHIGGEIPSYVHNRYILLYLELKSACRTSPDFQGTVITATPCFQLMTDETETLTDTHIHPHTHMQNHYGHL